MSNPTTLAARTIPFAVSEDDSTYKNLVCKKVASLNVDVPVTQEESDCAVHTSVGTAAASFECEFVFNTTPNGSTELSGNTIMGYALNGTQVYVKFASGSYYIRKAAGYFSNVREQLPQGGLLTVNCTFTVDGTLTTS